MPRRPRSEKRMLQEQDTVGMLRDARKEQEELSGKKKAASALGHEERLAMLREQEAGGGGRPRRVPRPGKPLKRKG
jgi:hypothetical protein